MPEKKMLLFMPWCPIDREYSVGDYRLVPFKPGDPNTGEAAEISRNLAPYKTIKGEPLQKVCLLHVGKGPLTRYLEPTELERAFQFAELACFCSLSEREPCSYRHRVNRDCFTMYAKEFESRNSFVGLRSRRLDGISIDGRNTDELFISAPIHCSLSDVSIDEELLASLVKKEGMKWLNAITCFNRANTDSPDGFNYWEWPLLDSAFEQILGKKLVRRATKFAKFFLDESLVSGSEKSIRKSIPYKWMCNFREIRNEFAHGNLNPTLSSGRSFLEELLLARMAFPLLLKMCLNKERRYDLSPHDRASIKILFGEFSEIPNFLQPPPDAINSADSHWQRLHCELRDRIALEDELGELLRDEDC